MKENLTSKNIMCFVMLTEEALESCDICLVIGTSSVVYPAAMFAPMAARRGIPVAEFNLEKTPETYNFQYVISFNRVASYCRI
jgi:NAD-dependent SIR2 family protein deacetylase